MSEPKGVRSMFSVKGRVKWLRLQAEKWTRPRLCSSPALGCSMRLRKYFERTIRERIRIAYCGLLQCGGDLDAEQTQESMWLSFAKNAARPLTDH
jgi:hypothetical protein